ncbi:MAG: GFA family protein [Alphaproteobacteria bacterium]
MSDEGKQFKGSCLCGKVSLKIRDQPHMTANCHCLNCQKTSGAGHAFHLMFDAGQVEVTGETKGYQYTADSGSEVTVYFCPECGSTTHGRTARFGNMITVRAAILDDSSGLTPQVSVYRKRLRDWDHLADGPAFDAMPPAEALPAD